MFDIDGWCSKHHLVIAGCDEPARPFGVLLSAWTASRMMSKYVGIGSSFVLKSLVGGDSEEAQKATTQSGARGTSVAQSAGLRLLLLASAGDGRRETSLRAPHRPRDRSRCHHGLEAIFSRICAARARSAGAEVGDAAPEAHEALGAEIRCKSHASRRAAEICEPHSPRAPTADPRGAESHGANTTNPPLPEREPARVQRELRALRREPSAGRRGRRPQLLPRRRRVGGAVRRRRQLLQLPAGLPRVQPGADFARRQAATAAPRGGGEPLADAAAPTRRHDFRP